MRIISTSLFERKKGGAYQGMLVIPGGGIEEGETQLEAMQREILEETGIDISHASIKQLDYIATGESEKTLKFDDDFGDGQWYTPSELQGESLGANTKMTLQKLNFL